jgi:hypothetical protein
MQYFVIYTPDDPISVMLSQRCIYSGKKFGVQIEVAEGFPKSNTRKYALENGLSFGFDMY